MKKVTVCIPVYTEKNQVTDLIKEVAYQLNGKYSVKFIIAAGFENAYFYISRRVKLNNAITVIENCNKGKPHAYNEMLRFVDEADTVVFADADITLASETLKSLLDVSLSCKDYKCFVSNVLYKTTSGGILKVFSDLHNLRQQSIFKYRPCVNGRLFAASRKHLPTEFPTDSYTDDIFLSEYIGTKFIMMVEDSIAYSKMPGTFSDFIKYREKIAKGKIQFHRSSIKKTLYTLRTELFIELHLIRHLNFVQVLSWSLERLLVAFLFAKNYLFYKDAESFFQWEIVESTK